MFPNITTLGGTGVRTATYEFGERHNPAHNSQWAGKSVPHNVGCILKLAEPSQWSNYLVILKISPVKRVGVIILALETQDYQDTQSMLRLPETKTGWELLVPRSEADTKFHPLCFLFNFTGVMMSTQSKVNIHLKVLGKFRIKIWLLFQKNLSVFDIFISFFCFVLFVQLAYKSCWFLTALTSVVGCVAHPLSLIS